MKFSNYVMSNFPRKPHDSLCGNLGGSIHWILIFLILILNDVFPLCEIIGLIPHLENLLPNLRVINVLLIEYPDLLIIFILHPFFNSSHHHFGSIFSQDCGVNL